MTLDEAVAKAHAKALAALEAKYDRLREDMAADGIDDANIEAVIASNREECEAAIVEMMAEVRRQLAEPDAPTGKLQ